MFLNILSLKLLKLFAPLPIQLNTLELADKGSVFHSPQLNKHSLSKFAVSSPPRGTRVLDSTLRFQLKI